MALLTVDLMRDAAEGVAELVDTPASDRWCLELVTLALTALNSRLLTLWIWLGAGVRGCELRAYA